MSKVYTWSHPKVCGGKKSAPMHARYLVMSLLYIEQRQKVSLDNVEVIKFDEGSHVELSTMAGSEVLEEFRRGSFC